MLKIFYSANSALYLSLLGNTRKSTLLCVTLEARNWLKYICMLWNFPFTGTKRPKPAPARQRLIHKTRFIKTCFAKVGVKEVYLPTHLHLDLNLTCHHRLTLLSTQCYNFMRWKYPLTNLSCFKPVFIVSRNNLAYSLHLCLKLRVTDLSICPLSICNSTKLASFLYSLQEAIHPYESWRGSRSSPGNTEETHINIWKTCETPQSERVRETRAQNQNQEPTCQNMVDFQIVYIRLYHSYSVILFCFGTIFHITVLRFMTPSDINRKVEIIVWLVLYP